MSQQTAQEAYYAILRALMVGKQMDWGMSGQLSALRKQLGLSDDIHTTFLAELKSDPAVTAWSAQPAPKRAATPQSAPAAQYIAAPLSAPPARTKSQKVPRNRLSDPGALPKPAARRPVPFDNGHNLVGWKVCITQEDESTAEAVVTGYNPANNHHICTANYGTPDAVDTELPLAENPDAFYRLAQHPDFFPSAPGPAAGPGAAALAGRTGSGGFAGMSKVPKARRPFIAAVPLPAPVASVPKPLSGPPYPIMALKEKLDDPATSLEAVAQMLLAVVNKEDTLMAQLSAEGVDPGDELRSSHTMRTQITRELLAELC